MKTNRILGAILFFAIVLLSASCTFKVVSPKALQTSSSDYTLDNNDHISIEIVFNHVVDQNTVVVGKTLILETEKKPNAGGTLSWSADGKTATFVSADSADDLLIFDSDGFFTLHLIGTDTGDGVIKDQPGKVLDGDADGTDGGDYKTTFVLVG